MADRIDYDRNGDLDDVVIEGPITMGRLELLADDQLWGCFYRGDKRFSFHVSVDGDRLFVSGMWE